MITILIIIMISFSLIYLYIYIFSLSYKESMMSVEIVEILTYLLISHLSF